MPGPALHHMIAERLRMRIGASNGLGPTLSASEYAQLDTLLADPANLPYLYLGCQGPDFLFFNTNDVSPTLKDLVDAYYDVYDFIENFKRDLIKAVPQPVLDALAAFDEAANAVVTSSSTLTELQETFEDLQQVVDGLLATLLEAVKSWVSEFNLFNIVGHPYRDGVPEGPKPPTFTLSDARKERDWWWFDAMHYRKTGKLAKKLLDKTTPGSPLHLYAIGYLTHVSADTVGHPYVNAISGGPYRSTLNGTRRARTTRTPSTSLTSAATTGTARRSTRSTTSTSPGRSTPRTTSPTRSRTCRRDSRRSSPTR